METCRSLDIREYDHDNDLIRLVQIDRTPQIRVYQPKDTAVVLGRGSSPEIELNCAACLSDGIPVYQRSGGGCAVVIDPGNIIISVVLPTEGIAGNREYFNRLTSWLIGVLSETGFPDVYQDGISDLVQDNYKVGGSSIHRTKNYLYYTTSLLFKPDIKMMERYLKHPPREPKYRSGRSHKDFVGGLLKSGGYKEVSRLKNEIERAVDITMFEIDLV